MSDGEVQRADASANAGSVTGEATGSGPIIVVTAVHLSAQARAVLAEKLGPGHVVRDIREAGNTADIVLVPSMSGQGIGGLRAMFPGAKLLAGEFVDEQYGIDVSGPIRRALDIGVDGYFLAPDLASVAEVTREAALGRPVGVLTAGSGTRGARAALEVGGGPAPPVPGRLHLVDPAEVRSVAEQLGAVALDVSGWIERLGLTDADQQRQLHALVSSLTRDLLARGIDVVCAEAPEPSGPEGWKAQNPGPVGPGF